MLTNLLLRLAASFVQRPDQVILARGLAFRTKFCEFGKITVNILNGHVTVIHLLDLQRLTFLPIGRQRLTRTNLVANRLWLRMERGFGWRRGWLVQSVEFGNRRQSTRVLQDWKLRSVGNAIVGLTVDFPASLALADTAPLFEEERNLGSLALVAK
jgi:hypothetical protein